MKHKRKPSWLRVPPPWGNEFNKTREILKELGLQTVCRNANCPNMGECYGSGTATFLIMGNVCTRNCRFCDIDEGKTTPLDPGEPARVARAVELMKLSYAVVTGVTRDDLPDGGAGHFAETIRKIHDLTPLCDIEVLVPDFLGSEESIKIVLDASPKVFNHNIETVKRLYPLLRPQAGYERSLDVLKFAAVYRKDIHTKSGIMVGAGETRKELRELFSDLADANVKLLTIGQYLPPSREHYPLDRYYTPEKFDALREEALSSGMKEVVSSPLTRSSYHARELNDKLSRAL